MRLLLAVLHEVQNDELIVSTAPAVAHEDGEAHAATEPLNITRNCG